MLLEPQTNVSVNKMNGVVRESFIDIISFKSITIKKCWLHVPSNALRGINFELLRPDSYLGILDFFMGYVQLNNMGKFISGL